MAIRQRVWTTGVPDIGLREAFAEAIQMGIAERAGTRMSLWEWAQRVPEPKAGTLNFDAFPFQRELYAVGEDDREMVIMKGTQVGISAWGVRWAMYHTDVRGATGLYVFPTSNDVYDFGDARVKPLIDISPYLRSRIQPEDPMNKGLRKIGLGFIYFRGSESKRKLDSVDADHLVLDEYDTLAQDNIPDAERRLSGPLSKGLIRRLGVPSIPGYGIARMYDETDQRKWHVRCLHCGEWQVLTFWENIDLETATRICKHCHKDIDPRNGEWVATYPDRATRGYHVNRLLAPPARIDDIIKASKKRSPGDVQVFWNKDLGEPYAPTEGRLSLQALQAAQSIGGGFTQVTGYVGQDPVTMGIDVASTRNLTVRISRHPNDDRKVALFIGEVTNFDDLGLLMERYCLAPETRVLCADLTWRPVGEMRVGDRLLAFDEHGAMAQKKIGKRRFRVATVEACDRITRPCYRVTLTDGRQVVASAEHLWLKGGSVGQRNGYRMTVDVPPLTGSRGCWIGTADLRPGTEIRDLGQPWETDTTRDGGYLAGAFDGEASLRMTAPGFVIGFSQKPGVVMDRVAALLDAKGYRPTPPRTASVQGVAVSTVRGAYDTLRFLGACRPERLLRKVPTWIEGRAAGRTDGKGVATVASVEYVGQREVVAIGTSTKTLFAEGLFSHNSVNMAVIDHLPEGRLARSFAEKFPGRVYLVAFDTQAVKKDSDVLKINDEMRFCTVRRTEAMDATAELVRQQKNALPVDLPEGYVAAMQAPVRVITTDPVGRRVVSYLSGGPDDYYMAELYDIVATELFYYRTSLDDAKRETFKSLDDMMEFQRSALGDYDRDIEYQPGGRDQYGETPTETPSADSWYGGRGTEW